MLDLRHAFTAQDTEEAIFAFVRPYWIAFLPQTALFVIGIAAIIWAQVFIAIGGLGGDPLSQTLGILALGFLGGLGAAIFAIAALDFYQDIIIVTDRRLVDIDQERLFVRNTAVLDLKEVQDVSTRQSGFFATLFGYGEIIIQTAGNRENFLLKYLRHFTELSAIITSLAEQAKADVPADSRVPETQVVAIIEGVLYTDLSQLPKLGAMLPDDLRRQHRIPQQ